MSHKQSIKTNSVAFSPQANYTDWATADGRRILVQTFADRDVSRGHRDRSPRPLISVFWTGAVNFHSSYPQLSSWGWVHPVPDPPLLRNCASSGNPARNFRVCSQEQWPRDHTLSLYLHFCVGRLELDPWREGKLLFSWRMPSSGMLRRVALVRTDVSEELSSSFIRVARIGELRTTLAVSSNRRTLRRKCVGC
jgi:hypothetical protein